MKLKRILPMAAFAIAAMLPLSVNAEDRSYANLYDEWPVENKQLVYEICEENGIDQSYILAIIWNESRYNANATHLNTNGTIDRGLMQINDACVPFLTKKGLITQADDLYDLETNIKCGVALFNYHLDAVDTHAQALQRYQVGEGAYARGLMNDAYYKVKDIQNKYSEIIDENSTEMIKGTVTMKKFIELQSATNETNSNTYFANDENGEWFHINDIAGLDLTKTIYIRNESPMFWEIV